VVYEEWCIIFLVRMCFSCGVVVWFRRCAVDSCEKVYPFFIVRSSCSRLVAVYRVCSKKFHPQPYGIVFV